MNTQTKDKPTTETPPAAAPPDQSVALRSQNATGLATVDFGDDAGGGMENIDSSEIKVPFFFILQSNSPQCKPVEAGGMPGAQMGKMMNGGTGEMFGGKGGVTFIPVYRDHNFVEFTPRLAGGGFVASHLPDDPIILELQAKHGKFGRLPRNVTRRDENGQALDGTEITETFYLYGLVLDEHGMTQRVLVPFKSSQIKKYQAFMQRQMNIKYANPRGTAENPLPPVQPPLWAHRWRLGTVFEKGKKGEYYGWTLSLAEKNDDGTEKPPIENLIPMSHPLYAEGKAFNLMLKSGAAGADYKTVDKTEENDEIPF
jgi:hypothetical protein